MDEQERPPINLTEEQWARFDELYARYLAGPKNLNMVTFVAEGKEVAEWLLNKYRALGELFLFLRESLDEHFVARNDVDRDIEDVDIMIWAGVVARYANGYFQQRLTASVRAALKGVITEMHEAQGAILEAALGKNTKAAINPHLPSKAEMSGLWGQIIDEHLDSRFVRENRGGDRRSRRAITDDEKKRFAKRSDELLKLWQFIVDFFHGQEYEAGCLNMLKESERYSALTDSLGEPDPVLVRRVFARKKYLEEGQKIPDKLSAVAFALHQAAQEVGLPEFSHDWRRKRYYEGKKLLAGQ